MDTVPAPLKGKVALVTGGSRGIGAGIAEKLAQQGCTHIAITYHSNESLAEKTLDSIRAINSNIHACKFAADVIDPDFGPKVIEQALAGLQIDRIDILVCSAALADMKTFGLIDSVTHEEFQKIITANTWGPLATARAVINHMPPGGRIIMISSGSSKFAMGDPTVTYAASKAGMDSIARNLGAAWAATHGVTVNSISVGPIDTDALRGAFETMGPGFEKFVADTTLLKRIGRVEEVADIVAFVASPQASQLCGNQIPANGGALASAQS